MISLKNIRLAGFYIRFSAKAFFILCGIVFCPSASMAKELECPGFFYGHQPPASNLSVKILCDRHFALGYSEDRTSALWSAEHLTRTGLEHASQLPPDRTRFYPDERVPVTSRAQMEDYRQVPFIPAPLAPHQDMPDLASRIESYALTNAVPQDPRFHSLSWQEIENEFRREVLENGEAYIITGVGYMVGLGTLGWDQIHVPTHIWKAIYLPRQKKGRAIACRNQVPAKCKWVGWDELKTMTGISPFPVFDTQGDMADTGGASNQIGDDPQLASAKDEKENRQ